MVALWPLGVPAVRSLNAEDPCWSLGWEAMVVSVRRGANVRESKGMVEYISIPQVVALLQADQ